MFCNKCGNEISHNQRYCNKCGNYLTYNNVSNITNYNMNNNYIESNSKNSDNERHIFVPFVIAGIIIVVILVIVSFIILFNNKKDDYYFDTEALPNGTEQTATVDTTTKKGKYKTAIIADNVYSGISVNSISEANNLIVKDSINQKQSDYPKEIIQIENDIIKKYSITAVNLKEMDPNFARELEKVIDNIYKNFPKARGYLTNLTLTNLDMSEAGVIALFMPVFTFGLSNTNTTRPWIIKTQVQLNAKYFLNPERLEVTTETSSKVGHFPKNATRFSPVAHEFGHYLSFIALLNNYSTNSILLVGDNQIQTYYDIYRNFVSGTFSKQMLDEAYENYVRDNASIDFDEWRGQISEYALAKDDTGNYIYDETIAEAFHDVYLNGNNATEPSKYIVEVLKKYIER